MIIFLQKDGSYTLDGQKACQADDLSPLLAILDSHLPHQLILAPTMIVTTTITVPKVKSRRLHQAILSALEDSLLDDINELHVAYTPCGDNDYQVAYVNQALLKSALSPLEQAGLIIDFVGSPEYCLPYQPKQGCLFALDKQILVRRDKMHAYCLPAASLESLQLRLNLPKQLNAYNCPLDLLAENKGIFLCHEAAMLADIVQEPEGVNLRQGEFALKIIGDKSQQWWRRCAVVLVVFVLLSFLAEIMIHVQLQQTNTLLQQRIAKAYRVFFPHATAVVAPRLRVARLLARPYAHHHQGVLALLHKSHLLWITLCN